LHGADLKQPDPADATRERNDYVSSGPWICGGPMAFTRPGVSTLQARLLRAGAKQSRQAGG